MSTELDLERVLAPVIGTTEHPPNSNHIFVWDELVAAKLAPAWIVGSPYCAGGIVWTDYKAGAPILPVQSPFYCPSRVQYARTHGLWDTSGRYHPGDEVFFAWTALAQRGGLAEHVERVIADDGHTITTVGFNTSAGDGGSQANGDGVFRRQRSHGPTVLGALAYSRLLKAPVPVRAVRHNPFPAPAHQLQLGAHGPGVKFVQWAVGVPCDGAFGPVTDHAVRLFQRFHQDPHGRGLTPDGVVGPLTLTAMRLITHWQH